MSEARGSRQLLATIEQLLQAPAISLHEALDHAADRISEALQADKVDVFLLDPSKERLCASGTSQTPLGVRQHQLGLDQLPIANGGRIVDIYQTGTPHLDGEVERDRKELKGVREALGIRSQVGVPLTVSGRRRGVLSVTSIQPHFYSQADLRFLESVAHWLGMVAHRAELTEQATRAAADEARRAAANELLQMFAHDLGNYLFPLRARLSILAERAKSRDSAADVNDVAAASQSLEQMSLMLSELMDVGRLDHGLFEVNLVPVDLRTLARTVSAAVSPPGRPIMVKGREEVVVPGDPARLQQLLSNLLFNALKHSGQAGRVSVAVRIERSASTQERWAVVEVRDQGRGIPKELLPHLFEKFRRGPYSRGLGLGLYLARGIARKHGGSLDVESKLGVGTTFRVRLPGVEPQAPVHTPTPRRRTKARARKPRRPPPGRKRDPV